MIKSILLLFLVTGTLFAQERHYSEPSKFIQKATFVQINKNENEKTIIKSGLNENVAFYPSEIINLKENTKSYGLAVENTYFRDSQELSENAAKENAWIAMDEIPDLIVWFETYVIPNINEEAINKKAVQYLFNTTEITFKYEVVNNRQIFTVIFNNSYYKDKYFWTQSRVKDLPNILKTLQYLQSKK